MYVYNDSSTYYPSSSSSSSWMVGPRGKGPLRAPGICLLDRVLGPIEVSGEGDCSRSGTEGVPSWRRGDVGDVRTIASPDVTPNVDDMPGVVRGLGSAMMGTVKCGEEFIGRAL